MNYEIDLVNRRVLVNQNKKTQVVINEFDKLNRKFLEGTADKYECELVLLEVDITNEAGETAGKETRAFARRIGNSDWLLNFEVEEYII